MRSKMMVMAWLLLLVAATATGYSRRGEAMTDAQQTADVQTADDSNDSATVVPPAKIMVQMRNYGDSVRLRWQGEDYATWRMLSVYGCNVVRVDWDNDLETDTVAVNLKPLTLQQFKDRYPESDSLAWAAAELIYGERTKFGQTEAAPGGIGSVLEVYEEQQMMFLMATLVAEFRPDLADAMGLAITDHHPIKGRTKVDYLIKPLVPDSVMAIEDGQMDYDDKVVYKPLPMNVAIRDSISGPRSVTLFWPRTDFTAYDVERRAPGETGWTKLNDQPYISFAMNTIEDDCRFGDDDLDPGIYEYRLRGYDSFGDLTEPGPIDTVRVGDLIPPEAPNIRFIHVRHLSKEAAMADIFVHKDSFETDLVGYKVLYYNEKTAKGGWQQLNPDKLFAPHDSVLTVDISGLDEGTVMVTAIDTAGNVGNSMPVTMHLRDLVPPEPPTNVRSAVSPLGVVVLAWSPSPSADVRGYQVYYANDTTHTFMLMKGMELVRDTMTTDTIRLDANQRYIYYKVKAVDYAGNSSEFTPVHQRMRPNFDPPREPRLDSVWHTQDTLYTRWMKNPEVDVVRYRLFRKLGIDGQWQLVAQFDEHAFDSNDLMTIADAPAYDREKRYYYAMECMNETGCSSGLSGTTSFDHRGPDVVDIPVKLYTTLRKAETDEDKLKQARKEGRYDEASKDETKLVWEVGNIPAEMGEYYFVVFRRSIDEVFRGIMTYGKDVREASDFRTQKGTRADYYVKIRFRDGRESTPSNVVTVDNQ